MISPRPLGTTGLVVSGLGFGGATIGFSTDLTEEAAVALVRRALDLGITFFDTAPEYRRSEALIGQALAGSPGAHRPLVATKVGRRQTWDGHNWRFEDDWSEGAIRDSIETSLRRVGVEQLDLVQLHSPPLAEIESGRARAALERARGEGLVGHIGLSADGREARRALEVGGFETLQISYNVLEQEPLAIIAEAARRGIGVIAKQPLANGIPALRERPAHPDWARRWDLAQAIDWRATGSEPPLDVALRFVLDAPGVSTAIVGTSRLDHLEANARVASTAADPAAPAAPARR